MRFLLGRTSCSESRQMSIRKKSPLEKEGCRYRHHKSLPPDHLTTHSHNCLGPVKPAVIVGQSKSGAGAGSYHRAVREWRWVRLISQGSPRVAPERVFIIGQLESVTGAGSCHRTVREWHWGRFISQASPRVAPEQVLIIEQPESVTGAG